MVEELKEIIREYNYMIKAKDTHECLLPRLIAGRQRALFLLAKFEKEQYEK